jgi:RES domain-containing protein
MSNGESVALRVPSVVVPCSDNYLLNPAHPSFDEVEIGPGEAFPIDERLIPDR